MTPFIIYGLPRSRTAWLSHFLSIGDFKCYHESTAYMRTIDDLKSWLAQDYTGTAETAAAPGWRLINHYRPDIKQVVIRRPMSQVVASLLNQDLSMIGSYEEESLRKGMAYVDGYLDQIAALPGVLSVPYADLANEETCARVFEHCLPYKMPHEWWREMSALNIQVNQRALLRYRFAYKRQIDAFKSACRADLKRLAKEGAFKGSTL